MDPKFVASYVAKHKNQLNLAELSVKVIVIPSWQIMKEPDYFQSHTVMVKLSGDGAQYTHHTSYVLFSFTILTGKPENIHKNNSMN